MKESPMDRRSINVNTNDSISNNNNIMCPSTPLPLHPTTTTAETTSTTSALWHGLGLFGESYLLFSIGTLRPIWETLYPNCFSGEECRPWLTFQSLSYCVVLGVMAGMVVIGLMAGRVGRRRGSIITACEYHSVALKVEFPHVLVRGFLMYEYISFCSCPWWDIIFYCMGVLFVFENEAISMK